MQPQNRLGKKKHKKTAAQVEPLLSKKCNIFEYITHFCMHTCKHPILFYFIFLKNTQIILTYNNHKKLYKISKFINNERELRHQCKYALKYGSAGVGESASTNTCIRNEFVIPLFRFK